MPNQLYFRSIPYALVNRDSLLGAGTYAVVLHAVDASNPEATVNIFSTPKQPPEPPPQPETILSTLTTSTTEASQKFLWKESTVQTVALRATTNASDFKRSFAFTFLLNSQLIQARASPFLPGMMDAFRTNKFPFPNSAQIQMEQPVWKLAFDTLYKQAPLKRKRGEKEKFPIGNNFLHLPYYLYCSAITYANGGSLAQLINKNIIKIRSTGTTVGTESGMSAESRLYLVFQIVQAFAAMQTVGILHRDFKPDNLLLQQRAIYSKFLTKPPAWSLKIFTATNRQTGKTNYYWPAKMLEQKSDVREILVSDFGISEQYLPLPGSNGDQHVAYRLRDPDVTRPVFSLPELSGTLGWNAPELYLEYGTGLFDAAQDKSTEELRIIAASDGYVAYQVALAALANTNIANYRWITGDFSSTDASLIQIVQLFYASPQMQQYCNQFKIGEYDVFRELTFRMILYGLQNAGGNSMEFVRRSSLRHALVLGYRREIPHFPIISPQTPKDLYFGSVQRNVFIEFTNQVKKKLQETFFVDVAQKEKLSKRVDALADACLEIFLNAEEKTAFMALLRTQEEVDELFILPPPPPPPEDLPLLKLNMYKKQLFALVTPFRDLEMEISRYSLNSAPVITTTTTTPTTIRISTTNTAHLNYGLNKLLALQSRVTELSDKIRRNHERRIQLANALDWFVRTFYMLPAMQKQPQMLVGMQSKSIRVGLIFFRLWRLNVVDPDTVQQMSKWMTWNAATRPLPSDLLALSPEISPFRNFMLDEREYRELAMKLKLQEWILPKNSILNPLHVVTPNLLPSDIINNDSDNTMDVTSVITTATTIKNFTTHNKRDGPDGNGGMEAQKHTGKTCFYPSCSKKSQWMRKGEEKTTFCSRRCANAMWFLYGL
jgi:serine/threonine protein kinase